MTDTMLTHDGITQPVTEWALDYGIYPNVITDRLARGWTIDRAITTPMIVAPRQQLIPHYMPGMSRRPGRPPSNKFKVAPRAKWGGVGKNFDPSKGTGGGSVAQDIPQIEISE